MIKLLLEIFITTTHRAEPRIESKVTEIRHMIPQGDLSAFKLFDANLGNNENNSNYAQGDALFLLIYTSHLSFSD